MYNKLSFKAKLFSLVCMMMVLMTLTGTVSYFSTKKILSAYSKIDEISMPNTRNLLEATGRMRLVRIELLQLAFPDRTAEEYEAGINAIKEHWATYEQFIEGYLAVEFYPGEDALYTKYKETIDVIKKDSAHVIELYRKNPSADPTNPGRIELMHYVSREVSKHGIANRAALKVLVEFHKDLATNFSADAKYAAKTGTASVVGITIFAILAGLLFALFLSTSLTRKFTSISTLLAHNAEEVASASAQIAASSQHLSEATTEQAASLEETAASLEEISSMTAKSSDSAGATERSSAESQEKAEEGKKCVEKMLVSMNEINESNEAVMNQVNQSNKEMSEIVKVIQEIGNKTNVINDIVFQTKLLSFNASVEAARAGEHGKGFAVVAEEVGNLAQMSGNAAKDIAKMLESSISKVEEIVKSTKSRVDTISRQGKEKVELGVSVARECAVALEDIVNNVSKVAKLAQDISAASREQSQGISEINKALSQLDTVTQQNTATSGEAANAAEALSSQAVELNAAVRDLVNTVQGTYGEQQETETSPAMQTKVGHAKSATSKANRHAERQAA